MNSNYLFSTLLLGFFLSVLPSSLNAQCGAGQTYNTYCYDDGEVNVVAFEFCPTAGDIAQSEIIAGSFSTVFPANIEGLTVYEGASGSGTGGTIVLGPVDGDLTGMVITASAPDLCLIFVVNSNTFFIPSSCEDGFETTLEVCSESIPSSVVTFTALNDLCINTGVQTGLAGGSPTGGVFSGPGVTDDGNGMTYSFDPAAAGVGVHILTYTNGGSATDDVEVFALGGVSFTAPVDLCIDAGIQTTLGGGTPIGGVYSGPGVTDDGNGMTYSLNPGIAGLGIHTITYTEGGDCMESATDDIEILAACSCPSQQTSYFHCSAAAENDLVIFEICPLTGEFAQATINQGTYNLGGNNLTVYHGASGSGTGGTIIYGPQTGNLAGAIITGTTANQCLIFVSNTVVGGCQDELETALVVCGESINDPIFFTAPGDICINDGVQTGLSGGTPIGGVYSGSGITDDGNGTTYSFDPAAAGAGVHTLTYTEGGNSASDDIEVFAIPVVTYTAPADLCIDEGTLTNLGGGTPIGGIYSGPGVTDNGNGVTYSFNPVMAGIGTHTITYTEGGVCMETATDNIEVTAACSCPSGEITYFNCYDNNETNIVIFEVCPDAGQFAKAEIDQGTYGSPDDFITIYQGNSGSGTGGTIVFGPINGDLSGTSLTSTIADECLIFVSNSGPIASCADGFETSLIVCGSSLISNVLFTALPDLSVNAGVQTGLSGSSPTGGVYSGPGVTDDGNGITYTFDPAAAGVGVHTLTYTTGSGSASDDVEVFNTIPPTFSKSFNTTEIGPGSVSTLTFTIDNTASGTPATSIAFTDNLPAGMTVASPAVITSTCFNGNITATEGGTTISLSDGQLTGNSFCTISVNVTSSTAGTHTNTTGDLTSSAGNSGTASANLTVATNRPGFSKSFSPTSVNLGERSTLTLTVDNTANASNMVYLSFIDNLPSGMVIASPSNASSTNTGIGTFTAVPGTNVISYTTSGFTTEVVAGGTCTFSVDIIGNTAEVLNNVTENLTAWNSSFQQFSCGKASASLEVLTPGDILIQKSFVTNPVSPGGTTNLEFTITNLNRDFAATNISFTDDLSAVLAGLTATGTPLNDICGTGSQLSGTTLLTFTGGNIPPESSCTFSVPVQVPGNAAVGTYTNVTSPITADINGSTVTGNEATENLFVANVPTFTKTFLNNPIPAGGTTTLEFTVTNTSTTSALTDITFTDIIDDFINGSIVTNLPAAGSCGAGSTFFTSTIGGEFVFQMTGGNIAASSSCTFTVDLTIPANTGSGSYTNTTSLLSGTIDGAPIMASPATDDLEVLAIPILTKSFLNDPVDAGAIVNLEFTITYDEFATGDATDISFTDDLNAVIPGLAAVGLPMNDICGTGASISGTTNLTFSGGTLSPGGSCTFSVPVQIPAGVVTGAYTNTTSAPTATVGGLSATGTPATDDLNIGGFTFTKEFIDDPVIPGDLAIMRFTFDNTSTFDATNIIFTDNLNATLPGLVTEGVLPTGAAACGASTVSGTSFLIYAGGSVNAGTTCSFDIPVRVPVSAVSGTYTNITSNLTTIIDGVNRVLDPAIDNLEVNNNLISLTKTFTDDPITPGGTVTVEYTLTNLDPVNAISNIAFTNDFDGLLTGLAATGLPMSVCGGTVSGTGLLSFTGGSLAAGASCTFSVTLQTPASTPYGTVLTCTTSEVSGEINGLAVVGDPAFDDLQFVSLQLSKSIAGPVVPGESTTITFTITNSDPVNAIDQIAFTDDLDTFISGMEATSLPPAGSCGPLSGIVGTSVLSFSRGRLDAGQSCSFDVTVLVPCGTGGGTYINTTSTITGDGTNGGIVAPAATANLVVNAPTVTFSAPADLCINNGIQTGLSGGTPTSGVYSGEGVSDDGNGMTYSFDPAAAGAGTHTLTYTYTNANGCINSATDDIEVFALPMVTFSALADLCLNAGVQVGLGGGTPTGGVYSGSGVTDDGNGMTYNFDPAAAGVGTHTLTYTFTNVNGCTNSSSDDVEVFAIPNATFTAPADLCIDAGVQAGLGGGTPTGGVYSGTGVTDDGNGMTYSFDPAAAGVGTHTLTYTVGVAGCFNAASDDVEVFTIPTVTLTIPASEDEYCLNDAISLITFAGSPTGGVYSGPGVTDLFTGSSFTFNPTVAGVGIHTVSYTFTDANGCSNTATDNIEVFALPTVTFTALADLCLNAGVQAGLGGGTPTGGVYSGPGVTDDGNGMTYSFDPAAAGVGTHTLTYTFTNVNGCTNSADDDVEVFDLPIVNFTAPALDVCVDDTPVTGLGGGIPTGGVYSGLGVTDDGNGMTFTFDPNASSPAGGNIAVTYTFTNANGCSNSAMDDIFVNPICCTLDVTCPSSGPVNFECISELPTGPTTLAEFIALGGVINDNCNPVEISFVDNDDMAPGCSGAPRTVVRTITVTDPGTMETTDCPITYIFEIITSPTESGGPVATINIVECLEDATPPALPVIEDVCGNVLTPGVPVVVDTPNPLSCEGTRTYTYTYTDCSNLTFVWVFTYTIDITTSPEEVGGPVATTATVECLEDATPPALPVIEDVCGNVLTPVAPVIVDTPDPFICSGTRTYTYTYTDCSGLTSDWVFIYTIDDTIDPIITCPGPVTVACLQDVPLADINLPLTSDNCLAPVIVTHEGDVVNATQCDGGTITRTYRATDACGNFVECSQIITVSIPPPPTIVCPADMTVACIDDFVLDPNTATATSLCGNIVSVHIKNPYISGVPNCNGTVYTYTYVAIDDCGRSSECEQQILIQNDHATISVPSGGTITCFEDIDITVDDATVNSACANYNLFLVPPTLNGELDCPGTTYTYIYRLIDVCGNTVEEPVVYTTGNNDEPTIVAPVDLTVNCQASVNPNPDNATVTTSCGNGISYDVVVTGPEVNGMQDCSGTTLLYTYTVTDACGRIASDVQIFTINNDGPVIDCPEVLNIINCEDGDYNALIDAWIASVTATPYCGGSIAVTNDFNGVNGLCISNGFTNVTFIATDECGITNTCIGTIIITDTEAPEFFEQPTELLVPCNGVTQDIFDNWIATHGGAAAQDGCWGDNILWSTIPANPVLNCAGGPEAIIVEFVATDGCGNSSSVTGFFNTKIQPDYVSISGQIFREDAEAVENVQLGFEGGNPGIPDIDYSSNTGGFGFPEIEYEDNLYLVPEKNDDITNGVSTYDLILMYKHILMLDTLDSPYKLIAADINRSGHISTIDIVLLRRVILFIDTEFEFNSSWRFVEADFVFPNPANPFASPFPEVFMLSGLEEEEADFIGVKIGDLDLSAITHSLMADPDDRSALDDLIFEVADQDLKPEEQYRIDFTSQNFEQINGFQFTINFDQSALEVIEMVGADLINFDASNYGMNKLNNGAITVSWNHNSFVNLDPEEVVFSLLVNAKTKAKLRDVLFISSKYTRAEAYQDNTLMNVNLVFNNEGAIVQTEKFRLFQNRPNPFKDETLISFNLPEATHATLTISDINGRTLKEVEGDFNAGYHELSISKSELGATGAIYYQLMTDYGTVTKSMIVLE
jgi:hypothetical protein